MDPSAPTPVTLQVANVSLLSFSYLLHTLSFFFQASSTTVTAAVLLKETGADASISSLPYSLIFVVATFMPPAIAAAALRFGSYRVPFVVAACVGIVGGVVAALAVYVRSFAVLCVASALLGIPNTAGNFFRFAATTLVPPQHMSKAVSAVLVSGVLASFLGAFIAENTYLLLPDYPYLPVYVAVAGAYVVMLLAMLLVRYPTIKQQQAATLTRPPRNSVDHGDEHDDGDGDADAVLANDETGLIASEPQASASTNEQPAHTVANILRQPATLACMVGAAVPYLVMTSLMSIVPLVTSDRFEPGASYNIMSVHGISMFLPFFVIALLNERLTEPVVLAGGMVVLLASIIIMLLSEELWSFFVGMSLVGVGWSLSFLSSTTMLTKLYEPHQRPKTQAVNDVFVFGFAAIGTALSSLVYERIQWSGMLLMCVGVALFGNVVALAYLVQRRCFS